MATLYRVNWYDRTAGEVELSTADLDMAHELVLAAFRHSSPYAFFEPAGRDWWNDPPHPRLQRIVDSLDRISAQEYRNK